MDGWMDGWVGGWVDGLSPGSIKGKILNLLKYKNNTFYINSTLHKDGESR